MPLAVPLGDSDLPRARTTGTGTGLGSARGNLECSNVLKEDADCLAALCAYESTIIDRSIHAATNLKRPRRGGPGIITTPGPVPAPLCDPATAGFDSKSVQFPRRASAMGGASMPLAPQRDSLASESSGPQPSSCTPRTDSETPGAPAGLCSTGGCITAGGMPLALDAAVASCTTIGAQAAPVADSDLAELEGLREALAHHLLEMAPALFRLGFDQGGAMRFYARVGAAVVIACPWNASATRAGMALAVAPAALPVLPETRCPQAALQ